jgi:hypothetical protein
MRRYALHFLSEAGRTVRRYDFQAYSDHEATAAARMVIGLARGELRAGRRVVIAWDASSELSQVEAA